MHVLMCMKIIRQEQINAMRWSVFLGVFCFFERQFQVEDHFQFGFELIGDVLFDWMCQPNYWQILYYDGVQCEISFQMCSAVELSEYCDSSLISIEVYDFSSSFFDCFYDLIFVVIFPADEQIDVMCLCECFDDVGDMYTFIVVEGFCFFFFFEMDGDVFMFELYQLLFVELMEDGAL